MNIASASSAGPAPGAKPQGPSLAAALSDWSMRPRYTAADFITLLWRERLLMAAVFGVIFVLGAAFALTRPTTYPARSSLLVQLGQEYIYQPRAGDAGRGAHPETDQLVQSEVEILRAGPLREQVIEQVGFGRIFPKSAAKFEKASPERRGQMIETGSTALLQAIEIGTAPKSNVIRLAYAHQDREVAADVLNRWIEAYLVHRRKVMSDQTLPLVSQQRDAIQSRLSTAEQDLEGFLSEHRIGDFEAEKQSQSALQASLTNEQYQVVARLREVQGRLGELSRQVGGLSPEIGLYRDIDTTAENKLRDLRIQREELLTRYKPTARPVTEVEVQIAQMERMIAEGRGSTQGARRTGINPVYQTIQTERIQLRAEEASLQSRRAALESQIAEVTGRRLHLTRIEPEYQDRLRRRDALAESLRGFLAREQEQRAVNAIADQASDNIRVVQRANPAAKGSSLRGEMLILTFIFALATALGVGLGRIFLRRSFATASSAARTLDLPVLATAPLKPAMA